MLKLKSKRGIIFSAAAVALGLLLASCAGTAGPKISEAIRSAPSMDAVSGLNDQLLWIMSHAETGGEYAVMLDSDYGALTDGGNLTFPKNSGITNVTITIKSTGGKRTISPAHFKVGFGVTLILDGDITLKGPPMENGEGTAPSNDGAVYVGGGTFVMNEGSAIIGNTNNNGIRGGGVLVNGGAFYMNGGIISGNKCIAGKSLINSYTLQRVTRSVDKVIGGAFLVATGGKAPANADIVYPAANGGGVYVYGTGTFVKTGGTITGYDSDPENGNVVIDGGWPGKGIVAAATPYTVKPNGGHAIYFGDPKNFSIPYKVVNTTVGPDECFEFRKGIYEETRCENPKSEQPARDTIAAQAPQPVAAAETEDSGTAAATARYAERTDTEQTAPVADNNEAASAPPAQHAEETEEGQTAVVADNNEEAPPPPAQPPAPPTPSPATPTQHAEETTAEQPAAGAGKHEAEPSRNAKNGFTLGYVYSSDVIIFQAGFVQKRPITEDAISFVWETNIWGGWGDGYDDTEYKFAGLNIPLLMQFDLSVFSLETGAQLDLLRKFGTEGATIFNAGAVAGAGLSFDKNRAYRCFYRFSYGTSYYSQVFGVRVLF